MNKFLNIARSLAENYSYDDHFEYRLCALIVRGGKILSIGYNNRKFSPLQNRYKSVLTHCESTHAEVDAILNARQKMRLEGAKIYVVRIRRDGQLALAKPCAMCQAILNSYGIKRAIFSMSENEFGVLSF